MKLMLQLYHHEVISHSTDSLNPIYRSLPKELTALQTYSSRHGEKHITKCEHEH